MEEGGRLSASAGKASGCSRWSSVSEASAEPWHSTPVKKRHDGAPLNVRRTSGLSSFMMDSTDKQWSGGTPPVPAGDTRGPPSLQETEFPASDLSGSTIQRQRRELQLLVAELRDREEELNAMAASHHKQHHAREQDRHRAMTLEQRCSRLDEELQKRKEVIRVLTKRACEVETGEKEVQKELGVAVQQLCELRETQRHVSERCQDLEEKNQSLSSTVVSLSTQLGSLQVREEELSSMLKLKDKDVTEASGHILDLSGRLRDLETTLTESRSRENKLQRDSEENRRSYREARQEVAQLREELQQQVTQSSTQREEIIRLKQELQLLRRDLALTEGDSWKDELLELSRSKQERLVSELRCLRQVCENQENDLQLLRTNQENSRESLKERSSQGLPGSHFEVSCTCLDRQSSSVRGKNLRPARDPSALPAADLRASSNGDLGGVSAHLMDTERRLSSCSLRELPDESKLLVVGSDNSSRRRHGSLQTGNLAGSRGTAEHRYRHEPLTPQHHPSTSTLKAGETPPEACPRHGASQPASRADDLTF
ncbi:coiled-coil domain-containing protein 62 isoform X2 [Brachyistius frenatus]|uniref:coiled-coil domain-containing protein 62 isoform X2 n=1 Tax=Brachyistius frenatus TaxID=100188 RepID=UPI0037E706B3